MPEGLEADQGQRDDLQGAERGAPGHQQVVRPGEVQVVAGADDAAGQEDRGRGDGRRGRRPGADQAEPGEEEGDHRGGEDLEEALHPQVDDPPAPVFLDRQVPAVGHPESRAEEAGDGQGAQQQHDDQRALPAGGQRRGLGRPVDLATAGPPDRRPHPAGDQEEPEEQADEQADLPDPGQVEVLLAGGAEPPVDRQTVAHVAHDRQPLADHGAGHHDDERPEQHVDAEPLVLRLATADGRGDVQTGGEPGGGDPQDAELGVPGAGHCVRQDLVDRDAVERAALDAVVGADDADGDLRHEQGTDDVEVLDRRALRRGGPVAEQRVALRHLVGGRGLLVIGVVIVVPDHAGDAAEQQDEADDAPQHVGRSGDVVDQRLVRPVLQVGGVMAGGVGLRRPGAPPEEVAHLLQLRRVGQRAARDRVALVALGEDLGEVRRVELPGLGPQMVDGDGVGRRVVRVGADVGLETGLQCGLSLGVEGVVRGRPLLPGVLVEDVGQLAVQRVGRPVRRDVRTVTPDGADLLAADGLPDPLALGDVRAGHQDGAVGVDHLRGDRGLADPDLVAEEQQHGEGRDDDEDECGPPSPITAVQGTLVRGWWVEIPDGRQRRTPLNTGMPYLISQTGPPRQDT
ncbi:hypothetical protein SDC9_80200 [bioreactor metagenome]|uniref:Uncharacterized protein n=1 Tax=bioreactor metagenome TaxID=1076179 RepID=A0A644Z4I2_9ZZZZ